MQLATWALQCAGKHVLAKGILLRLTPAAAPAPPPFPSAELASLAGSPAAASSNIVPASPTAGRGIYRPRQPASQTQARQQ